MAALRQEHRYGLSCGKINKNSPNQTLYHVKLTDTAIRTLEAYQNLKVRADSRYNFAAFFFLMCACLIFSPSFISFHYRLLQLRELFKNHLPQTHIARSPSLEQVERI